MAIEVHDAVAADTSVLINLSATGYADRILGCLPFRLVATNIVVAELRENRRSQRNDAAVMAALVNANLLRTVSLAEAALQLFASLVIGPAAETLDDGEASTIAYAIDQSIPAVIDERKALRICSHRFTQLRTMSTIDILCDPTVMAGLGRSALADAVFQALYEARMRVLAHHLDWVIGLLIGADRAAQCPSLPAAARRR